MQRMMWFKNIVRKLKLNRMKKELASLEYDLFYHIFISLETGNEKVARCEQKILLLKTEIEKIIL